MKTPELTSRVMGQVVRYETARSRWFLWWFFIVLVSLLVLIAIIAVGILKNLYDFQTLDVLSLIGQDPEIISEYWQETIAVLYSELPWNLIVYGVLFVVGVVVMVWMTRRRRAITKKRLHNLANFTKKE